MQVSNWFVNIDGTTSGPHPAAHVRHWLGARQLPGSALFWPDGGNSWLEIGQAWPLLAQQNGASAAPAAASPSGHTSGPPSGPGSVAAWPPPSGHTSGPPSGPGSVAAWPPPSGSPTDTWPGQAPYTGPYTGPQPTPYPAPDAGPQQSRGALLAFTDRLADFAGVERIRGFSVRELFSLAARKHSRDEIEQNFATGLPGFVPPLEQVESDWFKPWMFVRFYGAAAVLFLGFVAMVKIFQNANLLPGMIMIGSFMVPLAVLVFFFEANTPRNISLFTVTHAFLVGGVLSLAITLVLVDVGSAPGPVLGPLTTGIVEEIGKLLAVFVIAMRTPAMRYPWMLNGMLFGAAVGAGFAAFESAGYALNTMLSGVGLDVDSSINVIFLRGALAPFGHVVWTALAAGALWRVKRDRPLSARMLLDGRVLRILAMVITLHAIWNFGFDLPFLLKYVVLGAIAWVLVLGMITSGLKQIKATQISAAGGGSALPVATGLQPQVPPVGS